jgi:hypothetical protein
MVLKRPNGTPWNARQLRQAAAGLAGASECESEVYEKFKKESFPHLHFYVRSLFLLD